jgi:sucrose-6-phosphate hydrolase SacC (GH32 family)
VGEETVIRVQGSGETISVDRRRSGRVDFHPRFAGVASAPCRLRDGTVKLRILVDTASVEVFANDGEVALTSTIFPSPHTNGASLFAEGGTVRIRSLDAWALRSIWP